MYRDCMRRDSEFGNIYIPFFFFESRRRRSFVRRYHGDMMGACARARDECV